MPKKSYNYAQLEAVAQEMRANADMVFFYEYQTPTATLPTGEVLDLAATQGLLMLQAGPDVLRFVPSLNITDAEVADGLKRLHAALRAFAG